MINEDLRQTFDENLSSRSIFTADGGVKAGQVKLNGGFTNQCEKYHKLFLIFSLITNTDGITVTAAIKQNKIP